jgi:hypothetical protein
MNTSHKISLLFTGLIDPQTNMVSHGGVLIAVTYEYFQQDQFTVYRTDRPLNKHGQSHGGVLIAVTYEYFPQDQFTVYRTDRPPNKQGQSHGGVLIAVTYEYFQQD